jgi:hypothetical protein
VLEERVQLDQVTILSFDRCSSKVLKISEIEKEETDERNSDGLPTPNFDQTIASTRCEPLHLSQSFLTVSTVRSSSSLYVLRSR